MSLIAVREEDLKRNDLQELKEAVADALTNLTVARVSGFGEFGNVVFRTMPQSQFASGFLLPRFNRAGADESSPISISVLGLDFQVNAGLNKPISIRPEFSIYVRTLPDWRELCDSKLNLFPKFALEKNLSAAIGAEIDLEVTNLKTTIAPPGENDSWETKKARSKSIRDIRLKAMTAVYKNHGLEYLLQSNHTQSTEEIALTTDLQSDDGESDPNESQPPQILVENQHYLKVPNPDGKFESVNIPVKWKRIPILLEPLSFEPGIESSEIFSKYTAYIKLAIVETVKKWCESEIGKTEAWRSIKVRPSDLLDSSSWGRFLAAAAATAPDPLTLIPDFDIRLMAADSLDLANNSRRSIRISLENCTREVSLKNRTSQCTAIFQTKIAIELEKVLHCGLRLDRVEPSYRYRQYMTYPAIGLNCGIDFVDNGDSVFINSTWSPKFVQPRIVPTERSIPVSFFELADDTFDFSKFSNLIVEFKEYVTSLESQKEAILAEVNLEDRENEVRKFDSDILNHKNEIKSLEKGFDLLKRSKSSWDNKSEPNRLQLGAPWRAWQLMNLTFYRRDGKKPARGWRLFQLGYIISQVSGLASRIKEFESYFDESEDEDSASLLYFPTGGGKSEAFYGTLLFAMFLDRLRGKDRGITGFVRYPLRLLTLQQAQRLLKLSMHAELVRSELSVGNWPFEIGFWVGSNNTPNSVKGFKLSAIPKYGNPAFENDKNLEFDAIHMNSASDREKVRFAQGYLDLKLAYNKVPNCPCCSSKTGLRVFSYPDSQKAVVIVCFNDECDWNKSVVGKRPIPFLLTDDIIYMRAPSIIVGTIDKLALIGQHFNSATSLLGMFGLARWVTSSGHLKSPRKSEAITAGPASENCEGVYPAYSNGKKVFYDPFPSLIIQDEAHLLDESLGAFSGLFQTGLEHVFKTINSWAGTSLYVAKNPSNTNLPRLPKIIAATATVSGPERQLNVLYQRKPVQFPSPGEDLYHSFYAEPAKSPEGNIERSALRKSLPSALYPEQTSPWMRLFISIMTNGGSHTTTTVSILSSFHLSITELWSMLNSPDEAVKLSAIDLLIKWTSDWNHKEWRVNALQNIKDNKSFAILMGIIDLHRVSLTYVTNKKGGDQVIDALDGVVRKSHEQAGHPLEEFRVRLISGGVDIAEIQDVMESSSKVTAEGVAYGKIENELRNIVATSAISHGVDVERFNSMFFAGLPSNIAEYIQASSRVGRTHVGAVILVPTPHSRKDRFVVETHDVFHRFLERMLAPPAVERWGENAVTRVLSSFFIMWAISEEAHQFHLAPNKAQFRMYHNASAIHDIANRNRISTVEKISSFALRASGFDGGKNKLGSPSHAEFYKDLVDGIYRDFISQICEDRTSIEIDFEFWKAMPFRRLKPPMTSLRDVDEAGLIVPSQFDHRHPLRSNFFTDAGFAKIMKINRGQRAATSETDQEFGTSEE